MPQELHGDLSAQHEADRLMVSEFAPPGILVNSELQIIQFRGSTDAFLAPPRGKATFDVLKMARPGLVLALRAAINRARKENKTVRKNNVRLDEEAEEGSRHSVNLEVIPLKNLKERCYLILFKEVLEPAEKIAIESGRSRATADLDEARQMAGLAGRRRGDRGDKELPGARALRQRVTESERELAETRDYLQAVQEQHDSANEELQASNEEAQSANEELQSINEELQTSKEELESTNE